ncbi:MAG: class III poly(R)-hydroxyalkanoic acid synthase subunit PhaE [Magnetococcales bacterium]|nr:class III poly(R)-hydroxyalkanoic acid synthase subunit PhaE [Magnetococcales bacterium]
MDNNQFSMNWMNNWSDLQKKMMSDWMSLGDNSANSIFPPINPFNYFQQSMDDSADPMWASFSPFQATSPEELARRNMMGAMNNFMRMSKGVFDTFQNMSEKGGKSTEAWTAELDKNLAKFREYFTSSNVADFGSLNPMSGWSSMLESVPMFSSDNMKKYMEGLGGMPSGIGGGESIEKLFANSLNMPGLGLNREKQEKMQKAMQLGIAYQKVLVEYQTLMNQSNVKAADLFKERLIAMAKDKKSLESLRDLHVLWVDCSEETNAKTVASKEYQEINPRLTNALLTLQKHIQSMTDDTMASLNMPTRKELNSAYLQIHNLKKRVRNLEAELKSQVKDSDAEKLNRLRDDLEQLDIDALRADVAALKKQLQAGTKAAAKPAAKPTAKRAAKPAAKPAVKPAAKKPEAKAKPATKSSTKKGE